jgi:hypothetical protein
MPFCRECGKGVEEDWVTCPFCSQPIGPPAARVAEISDSVVMGDVIVNDSKSISTAVKSASKCPLCGSIGTTQISCRECERIAYCNICEDEEKSKIAKKVKFTSRYLYDKEQLTITQGICEITDKRICLECVDKIKKCLCCENPFKSRQTSKEREIFLQSRENDLEEDPFFMATWDIHSLDDYRMRHQKAHDFIIRESWFSPNIVCDACFYFYFNPKTKHDDWYKKAKNFEGLREYIFYGLQHR